MVRSQGTISRQQLEEARMSFPHFRTGNLIVFHWALGMCDLERPSVENKPKMRQFFRCLTKHLEHLPGKALV